jgi:hypothetical protein
LNEGSEIVVLPPVSGPNGTGVVVMKSARADPTKPRRTIADANIARPDLFNRMLKIS